MMMKSIIYIALFGVLVSFITGCRTVPVTGRSQLMMSSSNYENELGAQAFDAYKQEYKTSSNATYNRALNQVGNAIKDVAEQDDFDWEFVVLDTPVENAFCVPGGKIVVYSGLMDVMNNEAELACIVAHEVAHAIARHGGERMSWGYLKTLGGVGLDAGLQNDNVNTLYETTTELGLMLPFSRSNEYEADEIGLILMSKAGYDPNAAVIFWSRFSEGKSSFWLETMTSTHPCDSDRIAQITELLPTAEAEYRKAKNPKGFGINLRK